MKTFEVRVGVNKDGYEVYRVQAEGVADVVRMCHESADTSSFEYLRDEGMANLTTNWDCVEPRDVREVEPPAQPSSPNVIVWSRDLPKETGWYRWRPTSDAGAPTQCVWVVGVEPGGVSCWMIAVPEPLILRSGEWSGPLEMK